MENVSPVQSSYSAMWSEYKDARLATTLLSMIHRIVEYHFIQHCSFSIENLRTRVFAFVGDNDTRLRLARDMLKYIYDEPSEYHDTSDDLFFTPDNDISMLKSVFRQVFEAMGQIQHYQKMSGEIDTVI